MKRTGITAAALIFSIVPALAQTQSDQGGLVNVNLQDVLNDLAANINIDKNNIPVTAQVPVSVAANVCGLSVNVLSEQASSGQASCTAKTGSQELTQVVQQQMAAGGNATNTTTTGSTTSSGGTTSSGSAASGTESGGTAQTGSTTGSSTGAGSTSDTADAPKSDDSKANTTGSVKNGNRSARQFAPGQNCEGPAQNCAPGHQADPRSAAPGQMKKQNSD